MKILVDIGHPGHVHLFKNFAWIMQRKGHEILFTARQKEFETELLTSCGFKYVSFGSKYYSAAGKIFGLLKFNLKMLAAALKFRPDIYLSHGSMYAAQVAWLLGKPHISFEDTGNLEQIRLYKPFTKVILTSDVFPFSYGPKQIRYKGHHEIAYLHPYYFKPDNSILNFLEINKGTPYAILRFVSWGATHDIGQKGLDNSFKRQLINILEQSEIRVFISSEKPLPDEFQKYQIRIPPERMHDALFSAKIFIGEGATMAMEAGVLGTPAVYINPLVRSYCQDLEPYQLVFNFETTDGVLDKIRELLESDTPDSFYMNKRQKFLNSKIDVTKFLVWFIENYPESFEIMKTTPDFQRRFR